MVLPSNSHGLEDILRLLTCDADMHILVCKANHQFHYIPVSGKKIAVGVAISNSIGYPQSSPSDVAIISDLSWDLTTCVALWIRYHDPKLA